MATVTLNEPGKYVLTASGKAALDNTELTVRIDGAEVGKHTFPSQRFEAFELPVELSAGSHQIELEYGNWVKEGPRPMGILFQTMKLLPPAPAAASQPATR